MKISKRMYVPAVAAAAILSGPSCSSDWGQTDPPAGVQTAPKLENVATYDFEVAALDPVLFKVHNNGDQTVVLAQDDNKGQVLDVNNGWVEMNNPMRAVTCEKAVSITFWVRQMPEVTVDEEGNETVAAQDLTSPLFTFANENGTQTLKFTANGWIDYDGVDGPWSDNDPAQYTSGYFKPDYWNYVALIVRQNGYDLFVDGMRKVSKNVTDFDCSRLVAFMNNAATFTIGSEDGKSRFLIDDIKLYRNTITDKEIARARLNGESAPDKPGGIDLGTFEYRVGDPSYNIGASDCSTGWWAEFSNYFRIPADTNLRLSFTNHTSGGGNWNNWNLCLCTDAERGGDGYAEYFVIRSDLYGWGDSYGTGVWTNEGYGDWDQFRLDMEGAKVTLDIVRSGASVTVTAVAKAVNGTVYKEVFAVPECGDGTQITRAFLIVDGSYLEMDAEGCYAYWPQNVGTLSVGAPDCSAAWWTEFSDYFTISSNLNLHLGFDNFTSGGGNWNNWNLCLCTDAERAGDGYEEYFVVRSDLYGWGGSYVADNWTNEGYGNWDQFRLDMEGAHVGIDIVREAEKATYTSVAKAINGTIYKESIWGNCGDGSQTVRAFLICDGSHFELYPEECYTYKPVL